MLERVVLICLAIWGVWIGLRCLPRARWMALVAVALALLGLNATQASMGRGRDVVRVQQGDSLWAIAAKQVDSRKPSRIAREWPRWHKRNRQVIGADPNRLEIGMRLVPPGPLGRSSAAEHAQPKTHTTQERGKSWKLPH